MSTGGMKDFIDHFDKSVFHEESECVSDENLNEFENNVDVNAGSDDNVEPEPVPDSHLEGSDVAAGLEVSNTAVLKSTDMDDGGSIPAPILV